MASGKGRESTPGIDNWISVETELKKKKDAQTVSDKHKQWESTKRIIELPHPVYKNAKIIKYVDK